MRRPLVVAAWMVAACVVSGTQDAPASRIAAIEGPQTGRTGDLAGLALGEAMKKAGVPGLSVAVIRDFEVQWAKAWGTADVVSGAPAQPDTLFQAASISKPVTAMAVLKAVQDRKLALDADINHALRSWRVPSNPHTAAQPVTLRGLLSHTSGTDDGFGFPGYAPEAPRPDPVGILRGAAPSNVGPVLVGRPPLTAFKYSGGGFQIVQLALTESTGRAFPDLMRDWVLAPLGMTNSTFEQPPPPALDKRAARAHTRDGMPEKDKYHVYPEMAAAGLWTTPGDLARFAIEIQRSLHGKSNRVLSRLTTLEMTTPVGVGPYGLGLAVVKDGEGWYLQHGGSNRGFRATMVFHRLKGYGVVAMANSDGGGRVLDEVRQRVAAAYRWDTLDKPLAR